MDTLVETQQGDMNPQQPQQDEKQQPLQTNPGPKADLETAGQKEEQQNRPPVEAPTPTQPQQQTNPQKGPQAHQQLEQPNYNGNSENQSDEDNDDEEEEEEDDESNDTESEIDSLDEYEGGGDIPRELGQKPNQQQQHQQQQPWNGQNPQGYRPNPPPNSDPTDEK